MSYVNPLRTMLGTHSSTVASRRGRRTPDSGVVQSAFNTPKRYRTYPRNEQLTHPSFALFVPLGLPELPRLGHKMVLFVFGYGGKRDVRDVDHAIGLRQPRDECSGPSLDDEGDQER